MTAPLRRRSSVTGPPEVIERIAPSRPTVALLVGVVVALGFALVALVDQLGSASGIDLPRLEIPDVAGRSGADAQARLEDLDFVVQLLFQPNEEIPKGQVFAQRPQAGAKLPQGDVVTVFVSDGPLGLQVPDVAGQQQADGLALLQRSQFGAEVVATPDENVRPGQILATQPAAGQRVHDGGVVRVLVSSGPAPRVVPQLVNLTSAEALLQLGRAGLAPGRISRQTNTEVAAGTVLAADPPAGAQVPKDTPVALTVAVAEERVTVPFVVGLLQSTAEAVADELGLTVTVVTTPVVVGDPTAGRVVSQGTPPQSQVIKGARLQITVAVASEPAPSDTTPASTTPGG